MELLHNSGLTDPENWVECLEKVQSSQSKHTTNVAKSYPNLEKAIQKQHSGDRISPKIFLSAGRQENRQPERSLDSTLQELTLYSESISSDRPAKEVINIFNLNPLLPGIIIARSGKFEGMISRRRFFELMSRPYIWELFSKRPLLALYRSAKTELLILSGDTTIVAAARQSLERSPELIYEPIIVRDERENYQLLDVQQLLLAQAQINEEATKALRQAEEKYRTIFENAVDGIFQSTPDGRYLHVNLALAKLYGYDSPAELIENLTNIGQQLYVDPQRRAEFIACMEEHESIARFESQVYRKDGSIIWVSENARAIRDANGRLLYYEGTAEDITPTKQTEAQLRKQTVQLEQTLRELQKAQSQLVQSEKMSSLGQLVAGVAHEINNPVSCIYGNLPHADRYIQDLLGLLLLYIKHYPQPNAEIQAQAEEIDLEFAIEDLPKVMDAMQQGAERIREIVSSLRNFSRLDEGLLQPVDIHEGIDSTLLILQHRLKAKGCFPGIQVIKEYGNLPLVECYSGLLNQVFMNVLGNAIDALEMENRENNQFLTPTIWIRTEVVDNYAIVKIADNGPGMTEDVRQRLLEPFFTTKPLGKGTGLGLSISCQIVEEKHKGKLKCISALGEGSEFAIEIPLKQS